MGIVLETPFQWKWEAHFTFNPTSLPVPCVTMEVSLPSFFYAPTPSVLFNHILPSALSELCSSEVSEPNFLRDVYTE